VIRASTIAISGGSIAHAVAYRAGVSIIKIPPFFTISFAKLRIHNKKKSMNNA
jgi:predicted glycosyltransferase